MVRGTNVITALLILSVAVLNADPIPEEELPSAPVGLPSSVTHYISTTVYVTENITVNSSEVLIIDDTDMIFNCSCDGELCIAVKSGGSLFIRNGSLLTINRTGKHSDLGGYNYFLKAERNTTVSIEDSTMEYAGVPYKYYTGHIPGFIVRSNGLLVSNSTFRICCVPLRIESGNHTMIQNSTFEQINSTCIQLWDTCGFHDVEIINCDLSGRYSGNGIDHVAQGQRKIRNLTLMGNDIKGFYEATHITARGLQVLNNTLSNCHWGMNIFGVEGRDSVISNNTAHDCFTGFSVYLSDGADFSGNSIHDCERGSYIWLRDGSEASDNTFLNCSQYGAFLNNAVEIPRYPKNSFHHNLFFNCSTGMEVHSGSHDISDNSFLNCSGSAVIPSSNHIYYPDQRYPSNNRYVNNTIKNCSKGFAIVWDDNATYDGNLIINCSKRGICGDINDCLFSCNRISDCERGFSLDASGPRMGANNVSCCSTGIHLTLTEGSGSVGNNTVTNCSKGLFMNAGPSLSVTGNWIMSCDLGMEASRLTGLPVFHRNIMIDNIRHGMDRGDHTWDNGRIGNYWSGAEDYYDLDADGIVEDPYCVDTGSFDRYPMITPWGPPFNRPPSLILPGVDRVEVGELLRVKFNASDPECDTFSYELAEGCEYDAEIDPFSGIFQFRPILADMGLVHFLVRVYDNNGSYDERYYQVSVVEFNNPPLYMGPWSIEIDAGSVRSVHLSFFDPDGEAVEPSINSTDFPFPLEIRNGSDLRLSAPEGAGGVFRIDIFLTDARGKTESVEIEVRVNHVNRCPVIADIGPQSAYVGEEFSYHVEAFDPDEDELTYSIEYSGTGPVSIGVMGTVWITPSAEDHGTQVVTVLVSDGNGSETNVSFDLIVEFTDLPPRGPTTINYRVEAGDRVTRVLDVHDPEGEDLVVLVRTEDPPEWFRLDEGSLEVTLSPGSSDMGEERLVLKFIDPGGGYLLTELIIEVYMGPPRRIVVESEFQVMEREIRVLDLKTNYNGNGTIWWIIGNMPSFCRFSENSLRISPVDGDHSDYLLNVSGGIVNGSDFEGMDVLLMVERNLTGLELDISVYPDLGEYRVGDEVDLRVLKRGYDASLEYRWVWFHEGESIDHEYGPNTSIRFDAPGEWRVTLKPKDARNIEKEHTFLVSEGKEGDGPSYIRYILPIIVVFSILLISGIVFILARKMRAYHREYKELVGQDETGPSGALPSGWKAAPRTGPMPNYPLIDERSPSLEKLPESKDYDVVGESSGHGKTDIGGKEGS